MPARATARAAHIVKYLRHENDEGLKRHGHGGASTPPAPRARLGARSGVRLVHRARSEALLAAEARSGARTPRRRRRPTNKRAQHAASKRMCAQLVLTHMEVRLRRSAKMRREGWYTGGGFSPPSGGGFSPPSGGGILFLSFLVPLEKRRPFSYVHRSVTIYDHAHGTQE